MINQEFLSQCTDEQINLGVAWLKCKKLSIHGRYSWTTRLLTNPPKYCTSPNDIMPIAFANRINLVSPGGRHSKWTASQSHNGGMWSINDFVRSNENPLRAICEVYILMSV